MSIRHAAISDRRKRVGDALPGGYRVFDIKEGGNWGGRRRELVEPRFAIM